MSKTAILMCTKNGEKYVHEQVNSILKQKDTKIHLYISDDNSKDKTVKIIRELKKKNNNIKKIYTGKYGSAAKNFFFLISKVSLNYDFYAFSDQDDVWKSNKISTAIIKLKSGYDIYGSRTILTNKNKKIIGKSKYFRKKPAFNNSILQNIAGGNTMVFKRKIFKEIKKLKIKNAPSHDWLLYIYATFRGYNYYYDKNSLIYYRQHENNDIGSNRGIINQLKRVIMTAKGKYKLWNNSNIIFLKKIKKKGTNENIKLLDKFLFYRNNNFYLIKDILLDRFPFYRQTINGNFLLKIAMILKLI